ncbi:MAG: rod shape-determining protein MreD [Bacteroidota bacterium]
MKWNNTTIYLLRFILFVLIQGLVLNHMNISGYLNPLLYVMFILLLPFDMAKQWVLVLAFITGYGVDLFSGTPGMHAAALVLAAFLRPFLINALTRQDDLEAGASPTIQDMGFRWVFTYSAILVVVHHTVFFFIESFRISEFFQTITRSLLSSLMTIVLIMLIQFLFFSGSGSKRKFT